MSRPIRPSPDHYDALPQVYDHFTPTPTLTSLPTTNRFRGLNVDVRSQIAELYGKHELQLCPRQGLYYVGPASEIEAESTEKIMLLVIELRAEDLDKWRLMDEDVRKILSEYRLDDPHGVCVRYYKFNRDAKVENVRTRPAPLSEAASSWISPSRHVPADEQRRRFHERVAANLTYAMSRDSRPTLPDSTPALAPSAVQQGTQTSSHAGSRRATPIEERLMVQLFPRDERPEWACGWAFR